MSKKEEKGFNKETKEAEKTKVEEDTAAVVAEKAAKKMEEIAPMGNFKTKINAIRSKIQDSDYGLGTSDRNVRAERRAIVAILDEVYEGFSNHFKSNKS